MPSSATLKWLAALVLLAILACLQVLAADYNCGAQSWDCATLWGIATVSALGGLGLGLFLTAAVVLLGKCYLRVRPSVRSPEPKERAVGVAFKLAVAHVVVFGLMQFIGVLPLGWVWWLGVFGALGTYAPGTVYVIPTQ